MTEFYKSQYTLGARPDPTDPRDFLVSQLQPIHGPTPSVFSLRNEMSPIKNQAHRSACVAFATTAVCEVIERRKRGKVRKWNPYDFSEEWIYQQTMLPGGGAYIRDAMKVVVNNGVPKEYLMPYRLDLTDAQRVKFIPKRGIARNARHYRPDVYARLETIREMEESIFNNGPFVLGLEWQETWFDQFNMQPQMPTLSVRRTRYDAGGHAVCIVGYDRNQRVFEMRNSWGPAWGHLGYAYITYDTVMNLMYDAWALLQRYAVDGLKLQAAIARKNREWI